MNILNEKIKEEIDSDPENRGYAGKTNEEIVELLNNPYFITETTVQQIQKPPRIAIILSGIADLPNAISIEDVINSQVI